MNHLNWRLLFLCAIAFCTLGYTGYTLWTYWQFEELDQNIPMESVSWEIYSKNDDTHYFKATYSYRFEGVTYRGDYIFKKPVFINVLGAKHALDEFSNDYQNVWISTHNPGFSALQKNYPLKEIISTGLLWIIFLYFLLLPKYCRYRYG